MSTRQVLQAARYGRKIICYSSGNDRLASGYPVGADDFHWLLAEPVDDTDSAPYNLFLLHKGSVANVHLVPESTFSSESERFKSQIEPVRSRFLASNDREA